MKFWLILLISMTAALYGDCQWKDLTAKEWAKKLSDHSDRENSAALAIIDLIAHASMLGPDNKKREFVDDFLKFQKLLPTIESAGDTNDLYFSARYKAVKATFVSLELNKDNILVSSIKPGDKNKILQLMYEAMHAAHETNDEYLIAFVGQRYFAMAKVVGETGLAVMYGLYSTELYEKNFGLSSLTPYEYLSELMFRVREYEKCIEYCKKWLDLGKLPDIVEFESRKMFILNSLALAYHRQGIYDSAMYYYNKALEAEKDAKRRDWVGIINGNMGQVLYLQKQYDTARKLLEMDYNISMGYKYYENAANSLQWAARANAALGNKEKALQQVRESLQLIKLTPDQGYEQNIYYAAMEVYNLNSKYDSALYYANLYQRLHDTLEKRINLSSVAVSKTRLNEEKNIYNIRKLQLEKKSQLQQRNFIIGGIIMLSLISLLLINRQRLKFKYRQQTLEQQKKMIEQEMSSAKKQMEMFTQNIVEKTTLIEKLEQEMQQNQSLIVQQETISNLSNLTILTEDDWEKFKQLFEKIYPLFFQKLKIKAADITLAEQRMAALTRLNLTSRQMASMQGVSIDTVHKTRQRLRQRLGISNEINLEEYFAGI